MDNINDKRVIHFLSNEVKCFKREELVKKVLELSCEGRRLSYGGGGTTSKLDHLSCLHTGHSCNNVSRNGFPKKWLGHF